MELPAYDDLPRTAGGAMHAWGLWGSDDVLGSLNLLAPERVAAAAADVREGRSFVLSWSMRLPDPPLFEREQFGHQVRKLPPGPYFDDQLDGWNTQGSTQWDSFRHIGYVDAPGAAAVFWNGQPHARLGIDNVARRGIVGRGLLVDVAGWLKTEGRPLQPWRRDEVSAEDLLAALAAQGQPAEMGDVLLIRTGWMEWYRSLAPEERAGLSGHVDLPGLQASAEMVRVLWDLHPAAVVSDCPSFEAWPPRAFGSFADDAHVHCDPAEFLHPHLLSLLGMPIGEMFDLDSVAIDSARSGRYDGLFVSAPCELPGGVASPGNALLLR